MTDSSSIPGWIFSALSILVMVLAWQFLAMEKNLSSLPTPLAVLQFLLLEIQSGQLLHHFQTTLTRLGCSFVLAMGFGGVLGLFMGRHQTLNRLLDPWLILFLNLPALVTIILCYVWIGLNETAAILAVVVNKLPNVVVNMREGARALDHELLQMAKAYRFGYLRTLHHVVLPQLTPYLMVAARNGLALIWKIVLVVELLGRSDGVGYQLNIFFQMFNVTGILAYSLCFVALIQCMEWLAFKPLETHLNRWRH